MECPNCKNDIKDNVLICSICNFNISDHNENMSGCYFKVKQVAQTPKLKNKVIASIYSYSKANNLDDNSGGFFIIFGCIALLIPIIGVILGSIMIIVGIFFIISNMLVTTMPEGFLQWYEKNFKPDVYAQKELQASQILATTYEIIKYPCCKNIQETISIHVDQFNRFPCPFCKKILINKNNFIVYVPHPETTPMSDDWIKSLHSIKLECYTLIDRDVNSIKLNHHIIDYKDKYDAKKIMFIIVAIVVLMLVYQYFNQF
ncbi:MAG: hypothetical protein WAX77_02265 [Methylococcaceae bacterium]